METPAEGRQVPLANATKAQLRAFAIHLGATTTNFDTEAKLREKIAQTGYDEPNIIVFDGPAAKKSVAPKTNGKTAPAAAKVVEEPMATVTIHQQEGPGGKRHVFVGVNGRALLIPRNKPSRVKLRYLHVLENAIETKYEYDEEAKVNLPRDMPSYPIQVNVPVSEADAAAWHAYEAQQEAIARRREKAPVPVYDAAEAE